MSGTQQWFSFCTKFVLPLLGWSTLVVAAELTVPQANEDRPPQPPWPTANIPHTPTNIPLLAARPEPVGAELFGEKKNGPSTLVLTPEMQETSQRIRQALALYYPRKLNSRDHNSWEIMHAIIAYGVKTEILQGGPNGELVSGIGHLCFNGQCRGGSLLMIENGLPAARQGVNVQGHYGQFLAILAQSRLQRDYPLYVDGKHFTIEDLIESEKLGCISGTELTFKLIALMHYLPSDATWNNRYGQEWNIPRLIQEEIQAPIRDAACGGTHRLMGLSYAVQKRLQRGEPLDGDYARAKQFIDEYHKYTLALQNPDGSFSTEWFKSPGNRPDLDRRLQTTGHILEWLVFSLSDEELSDPRVLKAVNYLTTLLLQGEKRSWEIGPIGHALHALAIYDYRLFYEPKHETGPVLAEKPTHVVRLPTVAVGDTVTTEPTGPGVATEPPAPVPADEQFSDLPKEVSKIPFGVTGKDQLPKPEPPQTGRRGLVGRSNAGNSDDQQPSGNSGLLRRRR